MYLKPHGVLSLQGAIGKQRKNEYLPDSGARNGGRSLLSLMSVKRRGSDRFVSFDVRRLFETK